MIVRTSSKAASVWGAPQSPGRNRCASKWKAEPKTTPHAFLEDHEALIVVAATEENMDFRHLVLPAGQTLTGTMARAGGQLLAELANTEPSRVAVVTLSYQVHL